MSFALQTMSAVSVVTGRKYCVFSVLVTLGGAIGYENGPKVLSNAAR